MKNIHEQTKDDKSRKQKKTMKRLGTFHQFRETALVTRRCGTIRKHLSFRINTQRGPALSFPSYPGQECLSIRFQDACHPARKGLRGACKNVIICLATALGKVFSAASLTCSGTLC
ncbi:hypothetical protein [Desulfonatronum thioautotrophicum]|uniref:hypothetical protein n=1 Tax=Desulfonatronum thioautotrophicum TaxID=617001 RepID=UPI0012947B64|nr:hypothetical protein [Desulfonatronum thioautotrophicum]